ncbi:MAG: hypothetical protein SGJ09_01120 [Phycisphaerae bacterium]|nr:hypothetical protein [Phycisphaerae bacterium]
MPPTDYEDRPDPRQMAIFAAMTPERKIQLMTEMREGAKVLKRAYLHHCHPELSDEQIESRIRLWFHHVTP